MNVITSRKNKQGKGRGTAFIAGRAERKDLFAPPKEKQENIDICLNCPKSRCVLERSYTCDILTYAKDTSRKKAVEVLTADGEFIRRYASVELACIGEDITFTTIYAAIRNNAVAKGRKWRYAK